MTDWWEGYERSRIAWGLLPFPAKTKGEHLFKCAALGLIAEGRYPSARQILKRLGRDVSSRKVNLNGRQCEWLAEIRDLFGIEPYLGYSSRARRKELERWQNGPDGMKYPYKLRRGPKGSLIACDEYIDNRRAEQKAALKPEVFV